MIGRVHVEPIGVTFDLVDGESLMVAAERAGYWWPTLCHGNAQCTRCVVRVIDGNGLAAPTAAERSALRAVRWHGDDDDPAERLACQLRMSASEPTADPTADDGAPARVHKRGVRLASEARAQT